ncbi:hypothetical protein [Pedobacter hiemivivus]|uniref:Uncharacterized protein n=1 Tax=Pedobacter hiemivivus TaxID=2530454 RepID=A0A4R0NHL6_9SPHI|nr:hypothetical protein [Pedobacter hiemivivus]TCC98822.1 hypothetical protein EZ444_05975 [Pedobacter hiemivivus]
MKTQLFGIAAIVLAFAGSAFTSAKPAENNAKRVDPYYWYYNNPTTDTYELLSSTPSENPPGGVSCPAVITLPENCLKGFFVDPGATNAATNPGDENIPRQITTP